ncbi:MAG: carnitine 3-dehydrogenase [Pseudomonadota bacterium]
MKAAIIGGGVIGGGWAARFLLNGWDVAVFDPDPEAQRKLDAVLSNARRALPALYDRALPDEGQLLWPESMEAAARGADWVQESVPERLEIKHAILGRLCDAAPSAVIASSTSGFKPSDLNAAGASAIVAHPFNPVYLLPLVELVGVPERTRAAAALLETVGMAPLTLAHEIDAHIADRFLEAVWREALWLIKDGIATTEQIDDAIRLGFGLRWAQMGLFETYRIAGGEAGMAHFLAQFGPALKWPWTKLMDVPELDDALVAQIAAQSDAQSGGRSIRALEQLRDDNLVGILRALKQADSGAGAGINAHEQALTRPRPPIMARQQVPHSWIDVNGHMNIAHFTEMVSHGIAGLQNAIGAGRDYIAAGHSFFTVESHMRYVSEVRAGAMLQARAYVVGVAARKVHVVFDLEHEAGSAAQAEMLLVHVDLSARRSVAMPDTLQAGLQALIAAQGEAPPPEGLTLSV